MIRVNKVKVTGDECWWQIAISVGQVSNECGHPIAWAWLVVLPVQQSHVNQYYGGSTTPFATE